MSQTLTEESFYAVYVALDSDALLALLPELDRWCDRYMTALRQAEQGESAALELLNLAEAAWRARLDEADPEVAEEVRSLLDKFDQVKAKFYGDGRRFEELSRDHSRVLGRTIVSLQRRRAAAVKILIDRGILPPGLGTGE